MSITTISFYMSAIKPNSKLKQECSLDVLLLGVNIQWKPIWEYSRVNAAPHYSLSWQPGLGSLHTGKQLSEHCWEVFVFFVIFTSCIEKSTIWNVSIPGFRQWGWTCLVFLKASVEEWRMERAASTFRQCNLNVT